MGGYILSLVSTKPLILPCWMDKAPRKTRDAKQGIKMKVSQVQFDEVVASAQVRFGCTEPQAIRLAKSMVADMGKLPDQPVSARFKSTEKKGLSSIRFSAAALKGSALDGIEGFSRQSPSIKLCELLQDIEAMYAKNIGFGKTARISELTRDLNDWLFVAPAPANPAPAPVATAKNGKPELVKA
jgi:hypothetical protein